ncbi:MAG: nucleotidyltransferase domain-containing protein [Candidatus Eremiobacteraeota bacterium]|nr:nucleotidyltransferase domain-containing protein [Candidatus Eremiobacteraeota bacterium]
MNLLRTLVLKTSEIFPFSIAFRALYHLSVNGIVVFAWLTPEIDSLWIRGSYARGDFVPGRSDLDFLVVLKNHLNDSDHLQALSKIRRRFALFKRLVPFLGEIELLEKAQFPSWYHHATDRFELKPLVGGLKTRLPLMSKAETASKVLIDFVHFLLPNAEKWSKLEIARLCTKLLRSMGFRTDSLPDDRYHQIATVLQALQIWCNEIPWSEAEDSGPPGQVDPLALPSDLSTWASDLIQVFAAPYAPEALFVVVSPEIDITKLAGLLKQICLHKQPARIFTPAVLRFYLNRVSYVEGESLRQHRMNWGSDLIHDLPREPKTLCDGVLENSAHILSHVNSQEHQLESFHFQLQWFLRNLLFLEQDEIVLSEDQVLKEADQLHPEFRELRETGLAYPSIETHFRAYRFLAGLLNQEIAKRH